MSDSVAKKSPGRPRKVVQNSATNDSEIEALKAQLAALMAENKNLKVAPRNKAERELKPDDLVEFHNFSNNPITLIDPVTKKRYFSGPGPELHSDNPKEYPPRIQVTRRSITGPIFDQMLKERKFEVREIA